MGSVEACVPGLTVGTQRRQSLLQCTVALIAEKGQAGIRLLWSQSSLLPSYLSWERRLTLFKADPVEFYVVEIY